MKDLIAKDGMIRKKYLPAIYFDTSILIDYYLAEGAELELPESDRFLFQDDNPWETAMREILRSDRRYKKVAEIRKKIILGKPKVTPVTTPLGFLELMEWHAEVSFKQIAASVAGTKRIQKMGKKELGKYLRDSLDMRQKEIDAGKTQNIPSSGLEILMSETWLNASFVYSHGLQGIHHADIQNFNLSISKTWADPSAYAYLQLGAADIMHLLFAKHLGCEYFGSFDSDFERVKEIVYNEIGMKVLTSPDKILEAL